MRHLYKKVHLNRTKAHRKALFNNLSAALFLHKRIVTTLAKAKYARMYAERMITFARRGDLADRRHVLRFVSNKAAVKALFEDLGPHFKNRNGGYTRIIKLGPRRGDAAPMALLELVGFDDIVAAESKPSGKSRLKAAQKDAVDQKMKESETEAEVEETTAETIAGEKDEPKPSDDLQPEEPEVKKDDSGTDPAQEEKDESEKDKSE